MDGHKPVKIWELRLDESDPDQRGSTHDDLTGADSGKRAAADFPGVDLEVVKAMLGPENCSKASNGSKQFTVCASGLRTVTAHLDHCSPSSAAGRGMQRCDFAAPQYHKQPLQCEVWSRQHSAMDR